ncbi:hypothetical protein WDU94_003656 [Cyamophila willieti]
MIEKCRICVQNSKKNQKEPLIPLPMTSRAWERVATDLFTVDGQDYLVLVDSYSMWIEMFATRKKSAQELIRLMKSTFSRYGVPDTLYSDNQPFNSEPYRLNTTIAGLSYSPSELFFNRKLKTKLPVNSEILKPKLNENYEDNWKNKTKKQEEHYNQHVKVLPELKNNDQVFMRLHEKWTPEPDQYDNNEIHTTAEPEHETQQLDHPESEVVFHHDQPEIIVVPDQDSVDLNISNQVQEHNVVLDDEDYPPLPPPLPTTPPTPVHLRRSTRPRRPPVRFGDYLVWPFK